MKTSLLLLVLLLGAASATFTGDKGKGKGKGKPSGIRASRVRREEAEVNALGLRVRDLLELPSGSSVEIPAHLVEAMQQLLAAHYPREAFAAQCLEAAQGVPPLAATPAPQPVCPLEPGPPFGAGLEPIVVNQCPGPSYVPPPEQGPITCALFSLSVGVDATGTNALALAASEAATASGPIQGPHHGTTPSAQLHPLPDRLLVPRRTGYTLPLSYSRVRTQQVPHSEFGYWGGARCSGGPALLQIWQLPPGAPPNACWRLFSSDLWGVALDQASADDLGCLGVLPRQAMRSRGEETWWSWQSSDEMAREGPRWSLSRCRLFGFKSFRLSRDILPLLRQGALRDQARPRERPQERLSDLVELYDPSPSTNLDEWVGNTEGELGYASLCAGCAASHDCLLIVQMLRNHLRASAENLSSSEIERRLAMANPLLCASEDEWVYRLEAIGVPLQDQAPYLRLLAEHYEGPQGVHSQEVASDEEGWSVRPETALESYEEVASGSGSHGGYAPVEPAEASSASGTASSSGGGQQSPAGLRRASSCPPSAQALLLSEPELRDLAAQNLQRPFHINLAAPNPPGGNPPPPPIRNPPRSNATGRE